jgi:hypothetical protein
VVGIGLLVEQVTSHIAFDVPRAGLPSVYGRANQGGLASYAGGSARAGLPTLRKMNVDPRVTSLLRKLDASPWLVGAINAVVYARDVGRRGSLQTTPM